MRLLIVEDERDLALALQIGFGHHAYEVDVAFDGAAGLAKALRLDKLMRVKILPISFGFPFGLSAVLPVNLPLPTKIVMQVCEPIDIVAEFGEDPDIDLVDAHVRAVMQKALDKLASERRLPILG